jgi:hypothetical protein
MKGLNQRLSVGQNVIPEAELFCGFAALFILIPRPSFSFIPERGEEMKSAQSGFILTKVS